MKQAPPPLRLHWSPVEPSWLVSIGFVLLAALPHQVPAVGRRFLQNPMGAVLFVGLSAVIAWYSSPVLGAAMFIFLAGVLFTPRKAEHFHSATNLNKDKVKPKVRWFDEELMSEDPHGVQERTENPNLSYDEVTGSAREKWHGEEALGEHPEAIQDKAVSRVLEYDEGSGHH